MQKRLFILIAVMLLMVNIAVASVIFQKDVYQKRIDRILNKASTYTTISVTEKAEYQKAADEFFNGMEKCLNTSGLYDSQKTFIINTINIIWKGLEMELDNPNHSASEKAKFIKKELKEKQLLFLECGDVKVGNNNFDNTNISGENFSPVQKQTTCPVGQKLEGMCVYALPSYNVSLETAKSSCSRYDMFFATEEQAKTLSKHKDIIYKGYPGESGSIFIDGYVSGYNTYGKYYTVLCVKNFSPVKKQITCPVGQKLEGMCVYALPSYNVSLETAKTRCSNYGMSVSTREQAKTLSKHKDIIYKGYPGESGSIFIDGYVSGYNTYGKYYTVLCVK